MIEFNLTIGTTAISDPLARVDFFWNVDARGIASGAIDDTQSLNGAPIALFPEAQFGATGSEGEWGSGSWGEDAWGTESYHAAALCVTPPVCYGLMRTGAVAMDQFGNEQSGSIAESTSWVNSTPMAPTRFRRDDFSPGWGQGRWGQQGWGSGTLQQWFTFTGSPQLEVI